MGLKMLRGCIPCVAFIVLVAASTAGFAAPYELAPKKSEVGFEASYLALSKTYGVFENFSVDARIDDEDLSKTSVEVRIVTKSLKTDSEARDGVLRSGDYFNVDEHPEMTFRSVEMVQKSGTWKLLGKLTMLGVTKPVTMDVTVSPLHESVDGRLYRDVAVSGIVTRSDFGMGGNIFIGDDVVVSIGLTLFKLDSETTSTTAP